MLSIHGFLVILNNQKKAPKPLQFGAFVSFNEVPDRL